ncbi:MAG TPA: aminotransferase class III-fold pyridoxal phosphate-dependent enzyme [Candidatus Lustribacter sp.]|jgi:adenosylmethionine-8-amino-7-oxononanoate aminotransferase|nr:aminotransferase class III-fold pyridoxal phosphate-dependent enzyme [Candidatus Lustribacter sp.]
MSRVAVRSRHWLPFTQMRDFDAGSRTFVRGSGTTLVDGAGNEIFDAISSVWTTIHGHSHPQIVAAIARQAATLDHATSLGATNPVADELAERLCALTALDAALFASDGASAIEAALKMAVQFWQSQGEGRRTKFVHLRDSYHGDTAGAMGVSDIAVFRDRFAPLIVESIRYEDAPEALARDDVAAIVFEPRVQAAAGMRVVAPERYAGMRGEHAPLLIADEIATGFGRTGSMFAYAALGLTPDLVCLGKGITGGTLALSAVLATERIYDAFLGSPDAGRQFYHGHSYAGNPIACAAALASLELFETERTLAHVAELDAVLDEILAPLRAHPLVRDVRRVGLMAGIDVAVDAVRVVRELYVRGQFTRPIGSTIQLVPPLCSTRAELAGFVAGLTGVLDGLG